MLLHMKLRERRKVQFNGFLRAHRCPSEVDHVAVTPHETHEVQLKLLRVRCVWVEALCTIVFCSGRCYTNATCNMQLKVLHVQRESPYAR